MTQLNVAFEQNLVAMDNLNLQRKENQAETKELDKQGVGEV